MSSSKIIALDLGKFKTVCCVMNAVTRDIAFETVQTSPASLHELIVKPLPPSPADTLVVFEACDLAGWVHGLCSRSVCGRSSCTPTARPCYPAVDQRRCATAGKSDHSRYGVNIEKSLTEASFHPICSSKPSLI